MIQAHAPDFQYAISPSITEGVDMDHENCTKDGHNRGHGTHSHKVYLAV